MHLRVWQCKNDSTVHLAAEDEGPQPCLRCGRAEKAAFELVGFVRMEPPQVKEVHVGGETQLDSGLAIEREGSDA